MKPTPKRTKAEIRAFLNGLVGKVPVEETDRDLDGQCVTLPKVLFDFLGVPNPYQARGHAKDAGDTYVRQGIAKNGDGWLRVVVNRSMGVINGIRYGHIWLDLKDEANYESNGARALHVTKNTRPYSQREQVINLDAWVKPDPKPTPKPTPSTGDYKVVKAIKGYVNAANAKAGKNSNSTVPAGTYYTFSQADGMRNITRTKGVPGWWINPADNKTSAAPARQYITVKAGWGLSAVAQAAEYKDFGSANRWAAIAKLNGSNSWATFNRGLKPGQSVRVK